MYAQSVALMRPMLNNLKTWLDHARTYAEERGFDAEVLVQSRLAPDQFALVRQVQSACDTAKFVPARLTGRDAPSHADTESTMDELKARIEAVTAYLDEFSEADLQDTAERALQLPFLPEGQTMTGSAYLHTFALPNFFFHLTHAYAILRHNGVPLGKRTFLGAIR